MVIKNRQTYHISPDYFLRPCTAASPETCPHSQSNVLGNYGLDSHYTSDKLASIKSDIEIVKKAEDYKARQKKMADLRREDIGWLPLDSNDYYQNYQEIARLLQLRDDADGARNKFTDNSVPKSLATAIIPLKDQNDKPYRLIIERTTGTPKEYVESLLSYYGGDYSEEFRKNLKHYDSLTRTDDGGSIIGLPDPNENEVVYKVIKKDRVTGEETLAHVFSGNDIDGTFNGFMSSQTTYEGGPPLWTPPKETSPIEDEIEAARVRRLCKLIERSINDKSLSMQDGFERPTADQPVLKYSGNLSEGLSRRQLFENIQAAREVVGRENVQLELSITDDLQRMNPDGWKTSWAVERAATGGWKLKTIIDGGEIQEQPISNAYHARKLITKFEYDNYPKEGVKAEQNGYYVQAIMEEAEAYIQLPMKGQEVHYGTVAPGVKIETPVKAEEPPGKKKKGFMSLFS